MDLYQYLKSGESATIEFKENFDKKAIETAGAFANTCGGIIFIGIRDNSTVSGISVTNEDLKNWANSISQCTEPTIIPEIEDLKSDNKTIVMIRIAEYPIKPVAVRGRCFRRVAASNRQMTPQEIAQMHLSSTGMSWDALSARDSVIEDIDWNKARKYIRSSIL